ncbi:DUF480 domain-containing protein [Pseudomonadota bacterium]
MREEWGARVPKYQHLVNKALNLHSQGIALMATLMLRGPQTLNELKTNSHRLFDFGDLDDVQFALGHLLEREPSLVVALPRQPGQKEGRYAHLLSGEPDIPEPSRPGTMASSSPDLEARVTELEAQLEELQGRLKAIEDGMRNEEDKFV